MPRARPRTFGPERKLAARKVKAGPPDLASGQAAEGPKHLILRNQKPAQGCCPCQHLAHHFERPWPGGFCAGETITPGVSVLRGNHAPRPGPRSACSDWRARGLRVGVFGGWANQFPDEACWTAAQASIQGLIQNVIQAAWARTWVRAWVATGQPPLVAGGKRNGSTGAGGSGSSESKILGFRPPSRHHASDVSAEPRRESWTQTAEMTR